MISDTFKTIFGNKKILVFWGVIAGIYYLMGIAEMEYMEKMASSSASDMGSYTLFSIAVFIVVAIFIMAPFIYLVHKIVLDKSVKGWYGQGLKTAGFRYMIFTGILSLVYNIAYIRISMVVFSSFTNLYNGNSLYFFAVAALYISVFWLKYFVGVPIVSEGYFFRGIKKAFTIGKKYLLGYLGLFVLLYFFDYYVSDNVNILYYSGKTIYYVAVLSSSAFSAAVEVFLIVYVMHRYADAKRKPNAEYKNEQAATNAEEQIEK